MKSTTTSTTESLQLGIEAARSGQKGIARAHLTRFLEQEPDNIPALFWLAYVVDSPQKSISLLERVLTLNPENTHAKEGIHWARAQLGSAATPFEPDDDHSRSKLIQAGEEAPETADRFSRDRLLSNKKIHQRARQGALAHRARRTLDPLLTVAIVLCAGAILTLGIWILALTPADTLAAWLPTPVENVLVGTEPGLFRPLTQTVPSNPGEAPAEAVIQAAPAVEQFASTSDNIVIAPRQPDERDVSGPGLSPPVASSESAPESNELVSVAEASSEQMSSPVEGAAEPLLNAPEATNLVSTALSDFIGPADLVLTGPRLYEPVDYELLYRQPASPDEKWIEVNVTEQRVTAWEGNVPIMSFLTSTGLPNTPTVLGEYNIYWKLESTLMTGPDYYLPEVPYTMYFYAGYALHGAYWHDNFGNPMSHGCVNLSIDNAKALFEWADPVLPPGQTQVTSTYENPGTLVVVHQ